MLKYFKPDEVANECIQYIALAGPDGLSINDIWPKDKTELNEWMKRAIWEVFFDHRIYLHKIKLYTSHISDDTGTGGKTERKVLDMAYISTNQLNKYLVAKKDTNNLRFIANKKVQLEALGITASSESLTESNMEALRYISRFKDKGVLLTQVYKHLQSRGLAGASKNSNHIILALVEEGLVVKILERSDKPGKAVTENRIILRQFKPWDPSENEENKVQRGTLYEEKNFFEFYKRLYELMKTIHDTLGLRKFVSSDMIKLIMSQDAASKERVFGHHRQGVIINFLKRLWEHGESFIEPKQLPTTYIKTKQVSKNSATQMISCLVLKDNKIKVENSVQYASIAERKKFVREVKTLMNTLGIEKVGMQPEYSLYDFVLTIIDRSADRGVTVNELKHLTCAPPKYLYKLVKRLVESKGSEMTWIKETGESAQPQRRVYFKKYVADRKKTDGKSDTRLQKNKKYLREVMTRFKIINLQNLLSIMRKYEERTSVVKSDRRTILKHLKNLKFRIKDIDGPTQKNTGGRSMLIIWDETLISPSDEQLLEAFTETKSSSRFQEDENFSTKTYNRKVAKLKAYNNMAKNNILKNTVVDSEADDTDEEDDNELVPRIKSIKELKDLILEKKGKAEWKRFSPIFNDQTEEEDRELAEKTFTKEFPFPCYMERLESYHILLWKNTFGESHVDFDSDVVIKQGGNLFSRKAVDVSASWKNLELYEYLTIFPLQRRRMLLAFDFNVLIKNGKSNITVKEFLKNDPAMKKFLNPSLQINSYIGTLQAMGLLLTVKKDLKTGEFTTLNARGVSAEITPTVKKESGLPSLLEPIGLVDGNNRSDRELHYINYDDERLDPTVKQAIEKKDAIVQHVLNLNAHVPESHFCGSGMVNLADTFPLKSQKSIRLYYKSMGEEVRKANTAEDGSFSYNVLYKNSYLHPVRWNLKAKKMKRKRKSSSASFVPQLNAKKGKLNKDGARQFQRVEDMFNLPTVTESAANTPQKAKQKIKDPKKLWNSFITDHSGIIERFVNEHGHSSLKYLDRFYEKDKPNSAEEMMQIALKEDTTTKAQFDVMIAMERVFMILANGKDEPKTEEKLSNCLYKFRSDHLRLAFLQLDKEKKLKSLSIFKNSPAVCIRNGCLSERYNRELDLKLNCFISRPTFQSLTKYLDALNVEIIYDKDTVEDTESDIFLMSLIKAFNQEFKIDMSFKTSEGDDMSEKEVEVKENQEEEAPILGAKELATYEPPFSFKFAIGEQVHKPSDVESQPSLKQMSSHKINDLLSRVRTSGEAGLNMKTYYSYDLSTILETKQVIKVPFIDHHRLVSIEFISKWVIFLKGKKTYEKLARVRNQIQPTTDAQDDVSMGSISDNEDIHTPAESQQTELGFNVSLEEVCQRGDIQFTIARKWTLCNGEENSEFKKRLYCAILVQILKKPGISVKNLFQELSFFMSYIDLTDLVDELVSKNVLKKRKLFFETGSRTGPVKSNDESGLVPVLDSSNLDNKWAELFSL